MTRKKDNSFVIQDIDDIVNSPFNGEMYDDQIESSIISLQKRIHKKSLLDIDKIWKIDIFPKYTYTIRYPIINLEILYYDLGFSWNSKSCKNNAPSNYYKCSQDVIKWATTTLNDSWPSPFQVKQAFLNCRDGKPFKKNN